MIAGCIDRMRQGGCGGCDRRDACASLWQALGIGMAPAERQRQPRPVPRSPFLAFLSELAKAAEAAISAAKVPSEPRESPFRREVERRLEPMLAAGAVRIDELARDMGYSRQTLYRRLKAEGVTFAELLDGLRRRLALRFLRDEGLSVKEAAYRLGFSDPAAFSRAFKRWTGRSPRDMRS